MATKNKNSTTRINPAFNLFSSTQNVNSNGNIKMHRDTLLNYYNKCYEKGYKDANKPKFSKYWDLFLSIGVTLTITFLTCSNYSLVWEGDEVSHPWIRWAVLSSAIICFILFIVALACKNLNDITKSRDEAIKNIINISMGSTVDTSITNGNQKSFPIE